jgi:ribonuclease VapC
MVLDTSALIAILEDEPEGDRRLAALERAGRRRLPAASLVEAGMVFQARYGDHGERELDPLVQRAGIEVVPVTEDHTELARRAFRRYGNGRHSAGLNYGDCFSYALDAALGEPLLYEGDDFGHTDIEVAAY